MEMHRVRYFLAFCETLNFARAAETCYVSRSALTRAVRKLEEERGGMLLRREYLLTHLTDFGRLVRPQFEQMTFSICPSQWSRHDNLVLS
jgi:DNA-binding transcriptional LysR family regulator